MPSTRSILEDRPDSSGPDGWSVWKTVAKKYQGLEYSASSRQPVLLRAIEKTDFEQRLADTEQQLAQLAKDLGESANDSNQAE